MIFFSKTLYNIGYAICDGGSLTWEHKSKSDVLSSLDLSNITTAQLEELELERMKYNAFRVADNVAERIDCGIAPDGYMKSFASKMHTICSSETRNTCYGFFKETRMY